MERRTCSDANATAGRKKCHRLQTCYMLAVPRLIPAKFGLDSIFFFFFLFINWIFSTTFAVNCSLATLASDRRSLPVNPPGLLHCLTLKLAKRGRCTSLLDRHFFNYLLMLTISTEVESAIVYWDASCPDIFPNFVLYSLKSGVYLLLSSSDFQQIQINPWWWMQLLLRCKNNSTNWALSCRTLAYCMNDTVISYGLASAHCGGYELLRCLHIKSWQTSILYYLRNYVQSILMALGLSD